MIDIIEADFSAPEHAAAIVSLLDGYARDEMGGGQALSEQVRNNLVAELKKRSSAHAILAYVDGNPAGLALCFEAFSTFACKPILNIHDCVVALQYRGQGLSKMLFSKVEEIAVRIGCCKLTLEVLEGNKIAQKAYQSIGFCGYTLGPETGQAMFWEKKLAEA
jgi:ribosomal protein S18 acetylase RimI-like enzyme